MECETEKAHLRQRLERVKALLANGKQRLGKTAEDAAVLRRAVAELQRVPW